MERRKEVNEGQLLELARTAREHAYCPYSNFYVGAAVQLADGRTAAGCNVENVSYGLTMCAERCAVFAASPLGYNPDPIIAIAVVGGPHFSQVDFGETMPCGACLQVLAEFAAPDCRILCADIIDNELGAARVYTLQELFPLPFTAVVQR